MIDTTKVAAAINGLGSATKLSCGVWQFTARFIKTNLALTADPASA